MSDVTLSKWFSRYGLNFVQGFGGRGRESEATAETSGDEIAAEPESRRAVTEITVLETVS